MNLETVARKARRSVAEHEALNVKIGELVEQIETLKSENAKLSNSALATELHWMKGEVVAYNELREKIRVIEGHLAEREMALRLQEQQINEKVDALVIAKTKAYKDNETSLMEQLVYAGTLIDDRKQQHLETQRSAAAAREKSAFHIQGLEVEILTLQKKIRLQKKSPGRHVRPMRPVELGAQAISVHLL